MDRKVLYDQKWQKFLRRIWLFRHLPFVELVMASGSLVLGSVKEGSDFDVLISARNQRLYTARFFCLIASGFLGWRRQLSKPKDGFCFNHFITSESSCLPPPYSGYDHDLYSQLLPVFGSRELFGRFLSANKDWLGRADLEEEDLRRRKFFPSVLRAAAEHLLSGKLGDWLENILMALQIVLIKKSVNLYSNALSCVHYNDKEVRLWFNPKRASSLIT